MIGRGHFVFTMLARWFLTVTIVPIVAAGAAKPDFSGTYAPANHKGKNDLKWTLKVNQSVAEIEVTESVGGRVTTIKYKLDGSEGPCTTAVGGNGTCTVRFKGRTLLFDAQATIPQAEGRPQRRVHVTEEWVLSPDSKTLRVQKFMSTEGVLGGSLGGFIWSKIPREE
jgi:hypothetical protein